MAVPAGVGAGIQAVTGLGSAISSGVKGNRAANALDQRMQGAEALYGDLINRGTGMMDSLGAQMNRFNAPGMAASIDRRAGQGAGQLATDYRQGANALGNRDLAMQAAQLLGQGGVSGLAAGMRAFGGAAAPFTPAPVHAPAALGAAVAPGTFTANEFDFAPVAQLTQQALDTALSGGERARASALEQQGLNMSRGGNALDAALAARGISRDSGVAASALSQQAQAGDQAFAQLNRDLADQAQNAGLAGAQLDAGNALQLAGLGSQYNLGLNQLTGSLGAQRDALLVEQGLGRGQLQLGRDSLMAEQLTARNALLGGLHQNQQQLAGQLAMAGQANDLARAQGLAGVQGLNDAAVMNQTDLRARAVTDPLQLLQGVYQQNHLQPWMQLQGMQSGLANTLFEGGMAGLGATLDARAKAVSQSGAGKGAGLGLFSGGVGQLPASPKGRPQATPVPLTANPFARVL